MIRRLERGGAKVLSNGNRARISGMIKPGYLFAALLVVSPLATAEIFKCTDSKGNAKYQNFPCQIDSIGSKATALAPREETVLPDSGALPVRTQAGAAQPNI